MHYSRRMQRSRGLTLIELIVVFSIISIVTTISLPHYRNFICQRSVDYWADMIMSDLNRLKTKTILTEIYWGIEVDSDTSYRYKVSDDGSHFYEPLKKTHRHMNRDFAGSTQFLPGIYNIYFSPRACIGTTANSNWSTVAVFKNSVQQTSEFSFSLKSGPFQRTIKTSKNGECRGVE